MKALLATLALVVLAGCSSQKPDPKAPTYQGVVCFIEKTGKAPTEWGLAEVVFQYDVTHDLIVVQQSRVRSFDKNQCIVLH
jgi:uncharacterized lipoprotein YmbA